MSQRSNDQTAIRVQYSNMHRAMMTADIPRLANILTEGFHLVHMTGYDQPRDQWLQDIASRQMRYLVSDMYVFPLETAQS